MAGLTAASRRAAAIALALTALGLGACGGDSEAQGGADDQAQPLGDPRVGSVAQLSECSDWQKGSREERMATIEDVREQINIKDGPVETPTLSDEAAYEVLDNLCSQPFAKSFRLYKIYARAAGFQSFTE